MEVVVLVTFAVTTGGVLGMWNVSRQQKCRWCPHCIRREQEEAAASSRKRHQNYHAYRPTRADDCSDAECPGRH